MWVIANDAGRCIHMAKRAVFISGQVQQAVSILGRVDGGIVDIPGSNKCVIVRYDFTSAGRGMCYFPPCSVICL